MTRWELTKWWWEQLRGIFAVVLLAAVFAVAGWCLLTGRACYNGGVQWTSL